VFVDGAEAHWGWVRPIPGNGRAGMPAVELTFASCDKSVTVYRSEKAQTFYCKPSRMIQMPRYSRFNLSRSLLALFFLVLLVPEAGRCSDTLTIEKGLEHALGEVLAHNDLADIDFLGNTLGIGFRVSKPVPLPYWFGKDDDLHVLVMVTGNPPSMFAAGLGYSNEFHSRDQLQLCFTPRIRPNIRQWATDWGHKVTESMFTEAAGSSESIQWGGSTTIKIDASYYTRGGYNVCLTQAKAREPYSTQVASELIPPISLVRQVGALIAAGDLRNYVRTAKILDTTLNIDPEAMRNGHWYYGSAILDSVIVGIDPSSFVYRIDEFGWVSPPAFFVVPAHLSNRTVDLNLGVDVYHVCVAPRDIEAELARRSINFTPESRDSDGAVYSVTDRNKITLRIRRFRKCVNEIDLSQITDVEHGFVIPIVFSVTQSVDVESGNLNEAAIARVEWIIARAKDVRLGGIDIDQFQSKDVSASEQSDAIRLAQLLNKAFLDRGVEQKRLKTQTGLHPEKPVPNTAYVTVDAYTQ
jgi:hypothetical protein